MKLTNRHSMYVKLSFCEIDKLTFESNHFKKNKGTLRTRMFMLFILLVNQIRSFQSQSFGLKKSGSISEIPLLR